MLADIIRTLPKSKIKYISFRCNVFNFFFFNSSSFALKTSSLFCSISLRTKRVEELQSNLVELIEESRALPTTECTQKDIPLLVGKYVSHTFANGKRYVEIPEIVFLRPLEMLAGTLVSLKFLETEQLNKQHSFLQTFFVDYPTLTQG
jgi:hypothetical protein